MSDFRDDFYRNYVSRYKGQDSLLRDEELRSFYAWCEHKYLPILERIDPKGHILELGCGAGYFLEFMSKHGFSRIQGIDISTEQVQMARKRKLNVAEADVFEYLQKKDGDFDAIIAIDFIEHFTKAELLNLLKMTRRALKGGGLLVIQTPNGEGLFAKQVIYGDFTHLTTLTPSSLRQLLSILGFDQICFYETGPVAKNLVGRVRLVAWLMVRTLANTIFRIETGKSQTVWTDNMICSCRKGLCNE